MKIFRLIPILALLCLPVSADIRKTNYPVVTEADGSPAVLPYKLKFSNGTVTDNGDGTVSISSGSSGAPTDATYITQTANSSLSAEQALSELTTGLVKVTNGTGALSTAVAGTDFQAVGSYESILKVNTSAVGNVDGGTDDLITYAVDAGKLAATGDTLEIFAWGTYAANANAKTVKLLFGATTLADPQDSSGQNNTRWSFHAFVTRTGAATQEAVGLSLISKAFSSPNTTVTSPAETLANSITIKCTGAATTTNDIVQKCLIVRFIPAA